MAQGKGSSNGRVLSGPEAVRRAREQIEELLGRPTDTVSSFAADGSNGWVVTVEVVELERIPPTTSMLASYEAHLDRDGDLVELKRLRRYSRNQADQSGEDGR
jgi:hypothetical protein